VIMAIKTKMMALVDKSAAISKSILDKLGFDFKKLNLDIGIEIIPHLKNGGKGIKTLLALVVIALVLATVRFIFGIGSISNLTDGYPWGVWIGFDVMSGVALAAGGFTTAALVHLFGREKYHPVVRPAILTAFLGYVLVAVGLLVDLGRPWDIWHLFIYWNKDSALAEVGWCVVLYLCVLFIEFIPVILEKYKADKLIKIYNIAAPWACIFLVSIFVLIMTSSTQYMMVVFALLVILLIFFGLTLAKSGTMLIVYMAGVIFSTAHQSSLGTLMLLSSTKLNSLWYTQYLPLYFYLSAIAVGFAMVIFESTLASKGFGFKLEAEVIKGLGKILAWILILVVAFRTFTLWSQTGFKFSADIYQLVFFAIEIIGGLLLPMVMLFVSKDPKTIFRAAAMYVFLGVVLNRFNVSFIGLPSPGYSIYWPHPFEILISAGVASGGILVYYLIGKNFPVFEKHD
jgi:Ni/Fe-hydrogenase subunit HybB-like protein